MQRHEQRMGTGIAIIVVGVFWNYIMLTQVDHFDLTVWFILFFFGLITVFVGIIFAFWQEPPDNVIKIVYVPKKEKKKNAKKK